MKHILYPILLLAVLFSCTPETKAPQSLEVTWYIPGRYNFVTKDFSFRGEINSLDKLPWRLLDAIDEGKIKTYDSTLKEISRAAIEACITLDMRDVISLTKEECDIMLANGDSSFAEYLKPRQTLKSLEGLYAKGQDIDSLLPEEFGPAFESKVFQLELVEKVQLDTSLRSQKGTVEYIRLIIPKQYTKSRRNEILCQVKYEDFKTLGIPEQKILDEHAFVIDTEVSDLTIDDGKKMQRLSSLKKSATEETIQHEQIKNSLFKYFSKNIQVVQYDGTSKDGLIMEADY